MDSSAIVSPSTWRVKKFKDISGVSGIDSILDGRAAVLADFDNDGDLDVFLTTIQGEGHLLFRNNVGQNNNFVRIALEGTASGKDAFGTVVSFENLTRGADAGEVGWKWIFGPARSAPALWLGPRGAG